MNDELKRWNEDAPEEYRRAKSGYAKLAPRTEQLERMLARVELAVQVSPTPAPSRLSGKTWLWLVPVVGLVSVTLFFALATPRADSARPAAAEREPAAPSTAPAPSAPVVPSGVAPASRSASVAAPAPLRFAHARNRALRPRARSLAASDPLAELALLDRARRVLATNPARALALSEEHRRTYRAGQFAEERELLAIEALVGLDQHEAAARRARRFLRAHPNSVHAHRLEVILQRDAP